VVRSSEHVTQKKPMCILCLDSFLSLEHVSKVTDEIFSALILFLV